MSPWSLQDKHLVVSYLDLYSVDSSSMSIKFEMSWDIAKVQGNDTNLIKVYTRCKDWECSVDDVDVAPSHLRSSFP
jgi:hypothetical protein